MRYLAKDASGAVCETVGDMIDRVARAVARAELGHAAGGERARRRARDAWAEKFRDLMERGRFLPNSPTLMNAGRRLGQLAACFVLPVADSINSIFGCLAQAARIHQSGGGTGFNFSRLRPRGDAVGASRGVSSGPLSFIRIFDLTTETIKQGGARRGANMGILRVDHPDILEFIAAKTGPGLGNFNLSVWLNDAFMDAVERGRMFDLVNPRDGRLAQRRPAREILDRLAAAAHGGGEPGVIFGDAVNRANPTPGLGVIEATNPCGEQPLLGYESCNLGSLNLAAFRRGRDLDWPELGRAVATAVRFLDDVIDVNRYPLPRIRQRSRLTRKVGLGVMGFADLLLGLRVPYASAAAVDWAERIMAFVSRRAASASGILARERGRFPAWDRSIWAGRRAQRRHATLTTIAPTGSISLLAGVSPGVEPLFALAGQRRILDGRSFAEPHPMVEEILTEAGVDGPQAVAAILGRGRADEADGLDAATRDLLRVAQEIPWAWHLKIQAAFQRHTDTAVSKPINLPAECGVAEVGEAIRAAHALGLKGVTFYRDRSRPDQVISLGLEPGYSCACRPADGG